MSQKEIIRQSELATAADLEKLCGSVLARIAERVAGGGDVEEGELTVDVDALRRWADGPPTIARKPRSEESGSGRHGSGRARYSRNALRR